MGGVGGENNINRVHIFEIKKINNFFFKKGV